MDDRGVQNSQRSAGHPAARAGLTLVGLAALASAALLVRNALAASTPTPPSPSSAPAADEPPPAGAEAGPASASEAAPQRPHVILISVDTLRRDRLALYGYRRETAPNVTRLAQTAVVFDQAIAAATNTSPAHASMLTGRYPLSHGITHNLKPLDDGVTTLAQVLHQHGYRTAGFISGFTLRAKDTSLDRGFDHYDDMKKCCERSAADTFKVTARWLKKHDPDQPLFLFYHLFDPHYPYNAPEKYNARFVNRQAAKGFLPSYRQFLAVRRKGLSPGQQRVYEGRYDGEIRYADDYVGRLLALLRARGMYDNSLVVLLSDHGETLSERPEWIFDHGGRLYDEQVRVPFIIRFPADRHGGQRSACDVHHVDLMPTLLDELGIEAPAKVEGRSFIGHLRDGTPCAPRPMFSLARSEPGRVRHLPTRLASKGLVVGLRLPPHKLIAYPVQRGFAFELFDLTQDPDEVADLAASQPELRDQLARQLDAWYGDAGARLADKPPLLSPDAQEALRSLGYVE